MKNAASQTGSVAPPRRAAWRSLSCHRLSSSTVRPPCSLPGAAGRRDGGMAGWRDDTAEGEWRRLRYNEITIIARFARWAKVELMRIAGRDHGTGRTLRNLHQNQFG